MKTTFIQLVKLADAILMSPMGTTPQVYGLLLDIFADNQEIQEILKGVDAVDDCFFFPEDHKGIESILAIRTLKK